MADAKELISALRDLFHDLCDNDSKLKSIAEKMETGTYSDAHDYSIRIGELLSQSFSDVLTEDIFPQITQEIAREVIPSLLGTDHKMVSDACVAVQEHLNEQAGLGLKAVEPEFNVSRAYDLADKYVSYEDYEKAKKVLQEPVENFSQSIPDDSIRRNADFHWRSGMSPKIIRRAEHGACKWCRALAGTYEYKEVRDTGNDVYRRHENCRCMVDYVPANSKKRQDVWTKAEWEGDDPKARKQAIQEKEEELKRNKELHADNRRRRSAAVERIQKELGYSSKGASIWYNQNKEYIDKYGMDYMLDYERNNGSFRKSSLNQEYQLSKKAPKTRWQGVIENKEIIRKEKEFDHSVFNHDEKGVFIPSKTVYHSELPKSTPYDIINIVQDDGTINRVLYNEKGEPWIRIHSTDHNSPDVHPPGGHLHIIEYGDDGKMPEYNPEWLPLNDVDKTENADILL